MPFGYHQRFKGIATEGKSHEKILGISHRAIYGNRFYLVGVGDQLFDGDGAYQDGGGYEAHRKNG